MIDVKEAATAAAVYLHELVPAATDMMLEEVEPSDDDRFWRITLSASIPAKPLLKPGSAEQHLPSPLAELFREQDRQRVYKVLEVDANAGTVRSMKIRRPS